MKLIVTAVVMTAAVPASAATVIWDKVEVGMTRAQVEALYPAGGKIKHTPKAIEIDGVSITEKCKAEVNIQFENGIVSGAMLNGEGALGGRCADTVLTALSGKYGQPMNANDSGGSILARSGKVFVWNRGDGLTMRFKNYNDGSFGAGSLGRKSWELRYTTVAETIGL